MLSLHEGAHQTQMILSSFAAKNFKSVGARGAGVEIAPITVLVGENGAGKSTLLEALALTAQRARPSAVGKPVLDGEFVRYESPGEVFHKGNTESPIELAVSFGLSKDEREHYRPLANLKPDMPEIESMFAGHVQPEAEKTQGLTASDVGRLMVGVGLAAGDMTAGEALLVRVRLSTTRLVSETTVYTTRMALEPLSQRVIKRCRRTVWCASASLSGEGRGRTALLHEVVLRSGPAAKLRRKSELTATRTLRRNVRLSGWRAPRDALRFLLPHRRCRSQLPAKGVLYFSS